MVCSGGQAKLGRLRVPQYNLEKDKKSRNTYGQKQLFYEPYIWLTIQNMEKN
jgi:hypothetical protein